MPLKGRVGRHTQQQGRHAQNFPDDQQTVIRLLSQIGSSEGGPGRALSTLVKSGICGDELYRAITVFEDKHFPGQRSGFIDPDGALLKRIEALAAKSTATAVTRVRFVMPEPYLSQPGAQTTDITNKTVPIASNDVLWVGLQGDHQGVQSVVLDPQSAVNLVESSASGGIRWYRLSRPQGSSARVQAKDVKGMVVASFSLTLIELPIGSGGAIDFDIGPDGIPVHTPPSARPDYIDSRMEAIGYSIYLGGFQVYCTGMSSPIFVDNKYLGLDVDKILSLDSMVYDTIANANAAMFRSPKKPGGGTVVAYYQGAGGAVIAPTLFTADTAPRIIATYYEARRLLSEYVVNAMAGIAIGIVGGQILRMILGRIYRAPKDTKPPPRRSPPPPVPAKIRPMNDTVNVGGGGEIPNVTNVNPVKPGSGGPSTGIPNHVPVGMEDMGNVIQAGSVRNMYSQRLRYHDVDWQKGTQAAAKVMAPDGKVSMNVWTQSKQEVDALKAAFQNAGFKQVKVEGVHPGPGTMIEAVR